MNPISKNPTRVLGAPANWDPSDGECIGLPVVDAHGHMYSYWKMEWRERLLTMIGRPVRLVVHGTSHPPVALEVRSD